MKTRIIRNSLNEEFMINWYTAKGYKVLAESEKIITKNGKVSLRKKLVIK